MGRKTKRYRGFGFIEIKIDGKGLSQGLPSPALFRVLVPTSHDSKKVNLEQIGHKDVYRILALPPESSLSHRDVLRCLCHAKLDSTVCRRLTAALGSP